MIIQSGYAHAKTEGIRHAGDCPVWYLRAGARCTVLEMYQTAQKLVRYASTLFHKAFNIERQRP